MSLVGQVSLTGRAAFLHGHPRAHSGLFGSQWALPLPKTAPLNTRRRQAEESWHLSESPKTKGSVSDGGVRCCRVHGRSCSAGRALRCLSPRTACAHAAWELRQRTNRPRRGARSGRTGAWCRSECEPSCSACRPWARDCACRPRTRASASPHEIRETKWPFRSSASSARASELLDKVVAGS